MFVREPTLIVRAIVKAPFTNKDGASLAAVLALPSTMAEVASPKAPAPLLGDAAPATSAPDWIVVVPV